MKKILIGLGLFVVIGINLALITKDTLYNPAKDVPNIWRILKQITWTKKYNPQYKASLPHPKFSKAIQKLHGKSIIVKGYLVPTEMYAGNGEFLILSALPAKSCYFCGGAGPESVIEVYLKRRRTTFHAGKIAFQGILRLNNSDPDHLIYILQNAKQVFKK